MSVCGWAWPAIAGCGPLSWPGLTVGLASGLTVGLAYLFAYGFGASVSRRIVQGARTGFRK